MLQLTVAVAEKLGVAEAADPSLTELEEHIAPEKVLDKIEHEEGRPDVANSNADPASVGEP